jgi:hypothetical protein
MKHNNGLPFLLGLLLLASSALAQTADSAPTNDVPNDLAKNLPKQVVAARCAYTQAEKACAGAANSPNPADAGGSPTLAQLPRRMGPMGPPMGRAAYPGMWISRPSPAHVLIGAAFGFAIGAGFGSQGNASVRQSLGVGALFGLIGAGIGAGIPSFPSPRYHRRDWPDDDEEASRSKPAPAARESTDRPSSRPDPARSTGRAEDPHPLAAATP